MKRKTNISVQDNRGIRVTPSIILGDKFEGYASGDLLDANAVKSLVYDDPSIGDKYYEKQKDILIEEDGVYQIKDNAVYPVAHPDLSTQPSILPQRFGNLDIKEVLIANGREDEIPSNAMILCAWSFNYRTCIPATCKKENGKWSFITENGFTPDFTLVRYVGADSGYYYEYGEEGHDEPIPNNIIVYRATEPLAETTDKWARGLHTNAFNTTIKLHTFSDGVGTIEFNDDVTSIGDYAFYVCNNITSITIPNSVTSIGDYAFYVCNNITSITIPNSVTSIGVSAFLGCSSLTSIVIPNSVTSIGEAAFAACASLTSIVIPNSVTSIGVSAFSECTGLTNVTIGSGVTSIGDSAFNECTGLTSITSNATTAPTIQSATFINVKTGGTLTVPAGSTGYDTWMGRGNYYLGKYNWTMTSLPVPYNTIIYTASAKLSETTGQWTNGLHTNSFNTTIKSHTFNNGVGTIEFNADVTSIGDYAFLGCGGMTNIAVPNSVTSIGEYAFATCNGLESVTIPNSVTRIYSNAFRDCSSLLSVTIGSGVTKIEEGAFASCSSLVSITCNATTAPTIDYSTFALVKTGGTLYVPTGSTGYDTWMSQLSSWTKVEQ